MDFDSLVDDSQKQQQPTPPPQQTAAPSASPLMFDDLKEDPPAGEPTNLKFDDLQDDSDKYSTVGQQALTAIEGAGRGLTAGLTDALAPAMRSAATALGVPDEYLHYVAPKTEDMAARQAQNPITSTASELAGNIGLMSKLPQIGSKAINGMIQMGLIAGGDELSKAMLGQGDPADAVVAHIAGSGAMGLLGGAILGPLEKPLLKTLDDAKLGTKLKSFLAGMGHAASFPGEEITSIEKSAFLREEIKNFSDSAFKLGQASYKNFGAAAAGAVGEKIGGLPGVSAGISIEKYLEKFLGPYVSKASQKYVAPAILKMAGSGFLDGTSQVLDYATAIGKGANKITGAVEGLFKSGSNQAIDYLTSEKDREKLKEFIENGGVDQQIREQQAQPGGIQGFAKGGHVEPMSQLEHSNAIAHVFPEQNVMMNTAKARISGYLNSVRPLPNQAKLPYDSERKDRHKEREYDKILDLANQPLSILNHVKKGSLLPSQMKAFTQMYPELYGHLSKKITERMMHGQMKEEKKPPYRVRQAMSLFLGTSLDSTLTPAGIAAAQATFIQQKQQSVPKNSTSAMNKMGENAMTPEQSRTQRLNKS